MSGIRKMPEGLFAGTIWKQEYVGVVIHWVWLRGLEPYGWRVCVGMYRVCRVSCPGYERVGLRV